MLCPNVSAGVSQALTRVWEAGLPSQAEHARARVSSSEVILGCAWSQLRGTTVPPKPCRTVSHQEGKAGQGRGRSGTPALDCALQMCGLHLNKAVKTSKTEPTQSPKSLQAKENMLNLQ